VPSVAGDDGTQYLEWQRPGQRLEYRVCGCADGCWTARVREVVTGAVVAALRCDCMTLFHAMGAGTAEAAHPLGCAAFDGADKFERIPRELERLLATEAAPPLP
jgi:hypothetical protein